MNMFRAKAKSNDGVIPKSVHDLEVTALSGQVASLNRRYDEAVAQNESYKDSVQALTEELATLKANHAKALALAENKLNAKVNNALATIGVETFAIETISNPVSKSPVNALIKLGALSPEERTEFYKENKDLIVRAMNLDSNNKQ